MPPKDYLERRAIRANKRVVIAYVLLQPQKLHLLTNPTLSVRAAAEDTVIKRGATAQTHATSVANGICLASSRACQKGFWSNEGE
jgi:hypothetical protein